MAIKKQSRYRRILKRNRRDAHYYALGIQNAWKEMTGARLWTRIALAWRLIFKRR